MRNASGMGVVLRDDIPEFFRRHTKSFGLFDDLYHGRAGAAEQLAPGEHLIKNAAVRPHIHFKRRVHGGFVHR